MNPEAPSEHNERGHRVLDASRWMLMLCLIYAPWAYGCTRPVPKEWLVRGLLVTLAVFLLGLLLARRLPRCHPVAAVASAGILIQGWVVTLNPKRFFDSMTGVFYDLIHRIEWLPGTLDRGTSMNQMWLVTGLLGAFWISCDLQKSARWRNRLFLTMALTGVSVIALGILQHITGAKAIFWEPGTTTGRTFFATFRYHANAGAFVNLIFPLVLGQAFLALRENQNQFSKSFWSVAAVLSTVSMFLHVSRAAAVIGVFLFLGLFAAFLIRQKGFRLLNLLRWAALGLLAVVVIFCLARVMGTDGLLKAWESKGGLDTDRRAMVYSVMVFEMMPQSGSWGLGPGTFSIAFPYFTNSYGRALRGYWAMGHQDYLQTLVEWGWVGALLWLVLLPGGLVRGLAFLLDTPAEIRTRTWVLTTVTWFSLLGILLHAAIDFPLQIASLQLYAACLAGIVWSSKS